MLIVSNIGSLNVTPKPRIHVKMLKNLNFYNIKDITSFIRLTILKPCHSSIRSPDVTQLLVFSKEESVKFGTLGITADTRMK